MGRNSSAQYSANALDELESRLIDALKRDGRASVKRLAEEVGCTRLTAAARLDELLATGRLRIIAAVHPEISGLTEYVHVSVKVNGQVLPVAQRIAQLRAAPFVSVTSGEYQVVAELQLPGRAELYAALAEVREIPGVQYISSLVYTEEMHGTLLPEGPLRQRRLDAIDRQLIGLLQEDGRRSFSDLSRLIGLSPSATAARVNELRDSRALRIGPLIGRAGAQDGVVAGIGLNFRGDGSEVMGLLRSLPAVEYVAKTLGRFDAIATIAGGSTAALEHSIDGIAAIGCVTRVESWLHLRILKERYDWPLPVVAARDM